MSDPDALNARDLQTVSCNPVQAYNRGWEDAVYQNVYMNPYAVGTDDHMSYRDGHQDGMLFADETRLRP